MNIRRIKIWLSRGWFHVVSGVSLLLVPLFCNSCKSASAANRSHKDTKESVSEFIDSIAAVLQISPEMVEKIIQYEKKSNPRRMVAYGPAADNGEEETVMDLIPSKRDQRRAARRARK